MDLPVFANDGVEIELAVKVVGKPRIECGCRLAPRLANFISFEGALHDIGDERCSRRASRCAKSRALALRTESCGSAMLGDPARTVFSVIRWGSSARR